MKNKYFALFLLLGVAIMQSCKEENEYGQYSVEGVAPGQVKDIVYESLPGAVKIHYKAPSDQDLSYVKATYQLDNKVIKEAKASAYTNELLLEGFGKGDSIRKVSIVAVDVNRNESKPVVIDVVPKESPIFETIKTVSGEETYGGVKIKWTNPKDFNVIIVLNRANDIGEMEQPAGGKIFAVGTGKNDERSIQGIDSTERKFTVHIEDRWGNKTKAYEFTAKPIFEELIVNSSFKRWNPSSSNTGVDLITYQSYWGYDIEKTWDGIHAGNSTTDNCYSTAGGNKQNKITFDMQSQIKPTRMKLWVRRNYKYSAIGEYIRVWGSNDPQANPTFNQTAEPASHRWILLTEEQGPNGGYHIYKPSGLPGTQVTSADIQYAEIDGLDIFFKKDTPTVRYICIEMVSMWSGNSNGGFTIAEQNWWGKYIKK
jgi:hypothetical protein